MLDREKKKPAVRSEIVRKMNHAEHKWVNDTRYQLISNGN
jgi:hypothetical protein